MRVTMVTLQTLGLALLMFNVINLYETRANGQSQKNNQRHCNQSVAFCGGESYNPKRDTCCGGEKLTEGLSESMSQCCGSQAYNPLNEICCKEKLHVKLSPLAKCCEQEQYDSNTQLCCGKDNDKVVKTKLSPDHECCYNTQYNLHTECCCQDKLPRVQPYSNNSCCCEKNLIIVKCDPETRSSDQPKNCSINIPNEKMICNSNLQTEIYNKKDGFECCGHHYYNSSLWTCYSGRLSPANSTLQNQWPDEFKKQLSHKRYLPKC